MGVPKISSGIKSLDFLQVYRRKKRLFCPWTRQWKRFQRTLNAALAIVITTIKSWRIRRFIVLMKCPSRWLLKVDTFCQVGARGSYFKCWGGNSLRTSFKAKYRLQLVWFTVVIDLDLFLFEIDFFFKGQVLSEKSIYVVWFQAAIK